MRTHPAQHLLEAALAYAARGWPVLPLHHVEHVADGGRCSCARAGCDRPGKHPRFARGLLEHGLKDASTNPDRVRRWWARWPGANVGLRTGVAFDVLDIDGDTGRAAMHRWAAARDLRFTGPVARTGGGGWHLLVEPTGAGNRTGLLDHVDYRGHDGYVVAPPSVHASGHRYSWQRPPKDYRLPAAPPELRVLLQPQQHRPAPAPSGPVIAGDAYGQRALAEELAKLRAATPNHDRNHTLNRTAFRVYQLVAGGVLREEEVTRAFTEAALAIGLGERETRTTLRSARAGGLTNPRRIPASPAGHASGRRRSVEDDRDRAR